LYKRLKDIKLKITPTCFGSYVIHYQRVQSRGRTVHTYHRFKITLRNTDQAHDKISVNHYE